LFLCVIVASVFRVVKRLARLQMIDPKNTATHVVIGDTQVKKGVPTRHLEWIGTYIVEQFAGRENVKLCHLGDHADMESLSSYDKGKKAMEGRRVIEDIESANEAFTLLNKPLKEYNRGRKKKWNPEKYITLGNHEARISRAIEDDAQMEGFLSLEDLNYVDEGWNVIPFLEVNELDGVAYAHYHYNPNTGRPYSGENLLPRLKTIGRSFTMGHQQGMQRAHRLVGKRRHHGLVLGTTYLHDEKYLGPQGNDYWRGIIVKHQVEDGAYDVMEVSLEYLCRRFEGCTLATFLGKKP
jgi:hypothetical protein